MKASLTGISLCLTLLVWCPGCSREEASPPEKPSKVVMPIKRPAPENTQTPLPPTEEAHTEAEQPAEIEMPVGHEKPPHADATAPQTIQVEEPGSYTVKRGDTLASIAGKEELYGDPLKWPILYRLNRERLDALKGEQNILERELPEGLRLRVVTPDEARSVVEQRRNHGWVINVLSATTMEQTISPAIKLIKEGYPVYLTHATVHEKEWLRLRVGFFKTKAEAHKEGSRIMAFLDIGSLWITPVTEEELEEYGGY